MRATGPSTPDATTTGAPAPHTPAIRGPAGPEAEPRWHDGGSEVKFLSSDFDWSQPYYSVVTTSQIQNRTFEF